ncbi:hypothetical protein PI125_g288 [Phytophthora idaei]|nr:hypothetical protein PI125_g288 [Phytophthora idaei]
MHEALSRTLQNDCCSLSTNDKLAVTSILALDCNDSLALCPSFSSKFRGSFQGECVFKYFSLKAKHVQPAAHASEAALDISCRLVPSTQSAFL